MTSKFWENTFWGVVAGMIIGNVFGVLMTGAWDYLVIVLIPFFFALLMLESNLRDESEGD